MIYDYFCLGVSKALPLGVEIPFMGNFKWNLSRKVVSNFSRGRAFVGIFSMFWVMVDVRFSMWAKIFLVHKSFESGPINEVGRVEWAIL